MSVEVPVASNVRVRVPYEGDTVDADEMDFTINSPVQTVVSVTDDGAMIEIEHRVSKVYKLCNRTKENGDPIYLVTGNFELRTTLKREENATR